MLTKLLYEGGASGHLSQIQELGELTFSEIYDIFQSVFSGDIELKEKIDGIALSVTMKDGNVYFSRNKSTLKKPLSVEEAIQFFSDRNENIKKTFTEAIYDLESALVKLDPEEQNAIFNDGHNFVNLEIVNVGETNIIDYGLKRGLLIFHGLQQFDDNWKQINTDSAKAEELYNYLKTKDLLHQKTHDISGPVVLKINNAKKASKELLKIIKMLDKVLGDLDPKTTLLDYIVYKITPIVKKHAKKLKNDIDSNIIKALISRTKHRIGTKLVSINEIAELFWKNNSLIPISDIKQFINSCEKDEWLDDAIVDALDPIVNIVITAGQSIIGCLSGFIAANPSDTAKKLSDEMEEIINKDNKDFLTPNELKRYEAALKKLDYFNKQINATEGIVFTYKGKIYKLTSTFGPLNQLIGLFKFRDMTESKQMSESINDEFLLNKTILDLLKDSDFVVYIRGSFKPPHIGHIEMIKKYSEMKWGKSLSLKIMVSDPEKSVRPLANGQIISGQQAIDAIDFLLHALNIKNVTAIETSNASPYEMIFDDITEDEFKNSKNKVIVLGISDKEEKETIDSLHGLINSILNELEETDIPVTNWPRFINPQTTIITATDVNDDIVSATAFRKVLSEINSDMPIFKRIELVRPFLPKTLTNEEVLDYLDIIGVPSENSLNESKNLIIESTFSGEKDWKHNGKYDYAKSVIDKLLMGEDVLMGPTGKEEPINISIFKKAKLKKDLIEIANNITIYSYKDFDECLKSNLINSDQFEKSFWNNIFKGVYSNYIGGLASVNKGNAFEQEFVDEFDSRYKYELENALHEKLKINGEPEPTGALNQKRPLMMNGNTLYVSPENPSDVGRVVSDVTIPLKNDNELYLSLKYGRTVTFINCGVKNIRTFPEKAFIDQDPNQIGDIGKAIIEMFGINTKRFLASFDKENYSFDPKNRNIGYSEIDTTNRVDLNSLYQFLQSVIGYGFVLVHKIGSIVHYYDLREITDLKNFIGNINSVIVKYPIPGTKKRIDINVDTTNLNIEFNIRAKDGGFYPTHLMSDYIIKS